MLWGALGWSLRSKLAAIQPSNHRPSSTSIHTEHRLQRIIKTRTHGGRERERQTEREKETERERKGEGEKDRERERKRERLTGGETDRERDIQTEKDENQYI